MHHKTAILTHWMHDSGFVGGFLPCSSCPCSSPPLPSFPVHFVHHMTPLPWRQSGSIFCCTFDLSHLVSPWVVFTADMLARHSRKWVNIPAPHPRVTPTFEPAPKHVSRWEETQCAGSLHHILTKSCAACWWSLGGLTGKGIIPAARGPVSSDISVSVTEHHLQKH